MPGPRRTRAEVRAQMESAILREGRLQLADRGAAGLSLREVARSLGVVSSAVYRYVASRDELLTLLLVDAYSSLADDVDAGLASLPAAADGHTRLLTLGNAMRTWALAHPEQWGLIYGAPVPGYAAPESATVAPGTRVMRSLATICADAPPAGPDPSGPYADYLRRGVEAMGVTATPAQAASAVRAWGAIVGTISMEMFGQLGPELVTNRSIGEAALRDQIIALYPPA